MLKSLTNRSCGKSSAFWAIKPLRVARIKQLKATSDLTHSCSSITRISRAERSKRKITPLELTHSLDRRVLPAPALAKSAEYLPITSCLYWLNESAYSGMTSSVTEEICLWFIL